MPDGADYLRGIEPRVFETSVYGEHAVSGVSVVLLALFGRHLHII